MMGDGKELEFLTGVTGGACPGCEIDNWDPNKTRGKPHSIQPTVLYKGKRSKTAKDHKLRSLEKAVSVAEDYKKFILNLENKGLTSSTVEGKKADFRRKNKRYEQKPVFHIPFTQSIFLEFHFIPFSTGQ